MLVTIVTMCMAIPSVIVALMIMIGMIVIIVLMVVIIVGVPVGTAAPLRHRRGGTASSRKHGDSSCRQQQGQRRQKQPGIPLSRRGVQTEATGRIRLERHGGMIPEAGAKETIERRLCKNTALAKSRPTPHRHPLSPSRQPKHPRHAACSPHR